MAPMCLRREVLCFGVGAWVSCVLMLMAPPAEAKRVVYQGGVLDVAMPGEAIENQLVVRMETQAVKKDLYGTAAQVGGRVVGEIPQAGCVLLEFGSATDALRVLVDLQRSPARFVAYPNYKVSLIPSPQLQRALLQEQLGAEVPDRIPEPGESPPIRALAAEDLTGDPLASSQYWLWKVKEPLSPEPAPSSHGIAVLDTGVDYTHPDLVDRVVKGFDFIDRDTDPMDENGHGTHCAGIAAASAGNGEGIRGIAPRATIYAYRVLNSQGSGNLFDILNAVYTAADREGVSVLSLSLGLYLEEGSAAFDDLQAAIDYAVHTRKKIVCSAAGNEANVPLFKNFYTANPQRPVPAWYASSFTVGATQEQDFRANFSNYDVTNARSADGLQNYAFSFVDVVAPGTNVLSTYPNGQYRTQSGTSMSAPMVAGACARVWDRFPALSNAQVMERIVSAGIPLGASCGFPAPERRLDLMRALASGEGLDVRESSGLQGQVLHGEKGYPLEGVRVTAVGLLDKVAAETNRAGIFTLTGLRPSMKYTLSFSREGFVRHTVKGVASPIRGEVRDLFAEPLMPSRASSDTNPNWRAVVSWRGAQPGYYDWLYDNRSGPRAGQYPWYPYRYFNAAGMEANAYLRDPQGNIFYWGNPGDLSRFPNVKYLHDSASDSVPLECHLIQKQSPGSYQFWLAADPNDFGCGTIRYAPGGPFTPQNPVVRLYKGNTLRATIRSRQAKQIGSGTRIWHVFDLKEDTVQTINTVQDATP